MEGLEIIHKAKDLSKSEKHTEALELLKPLLNTGWNELALFHFGKILTRAGMTNEAQECFDQLINIDPHYREDVYLFKFKYNLDHDNKKIAFDSLNAIGGLKPDDYNYLLYECALVFFLKGYRNDCENTLNQLLERDPKYSKALVLLAKIYIWKRDYKTAIDCLNKVIDNYDRYRIKAYRLMLKIYTILDNKQEIENCTNYLNEYANDKQEDIEMMQYGKDLLNNGNYNESAKLFNKLVNDNKCIDESTACLYTIDLINKADNLLNSGYADEAYYYYKKLFRSKKHLSHALVGMKLSRLLSSGDKLLIKGEPDLALCNYNNLLDERIYDEMYEPKLEMMGALIANNRLAVINNNPVIYSGHRFAESSIGNIYLELGHFDKAKKFYNSSIEHQKHIAESVSGLIAIKTKNNDLNDIDNYLDYYKKYMTYKEYNRIKNYVNMSVDSSFKETNEQYILSAIIRNQKKAFNEDVDIANLYYRIKEQVNDGRLMNSGDNELSFQYFVDCNEIIGKQFDKDTSIVRVYCFMEKSNIINMYPAIYGGKTITLNSKVKKL